MEETSQSCIVTAPSINNAAPQNATENVESAAETRGPYSNAHHNTSGSRVWTTVREEAPAVSRWLYRIAA